MTWNQVMSSSNQKFDSIWSHFLMIFQKVCIKLFIKQIFTQLLEMSQEMYECLKCSLNIHIKRSEKVFWIFWAFLRYFIVISNRKCMKLVHGYSYNKKLNDFFHHSINTVVFLKKILGLIAEYFLENLLHL